MFCDSLVTSTAKFLIMTAANLDITNKTVRIVILELFVQQLSRAGLGKYVIYRVVFAHPPKMPYVPNFFPISINYHIYLKLF